MNSEYFTKCSRFKTRQTTHGQRCAYGGLFLLLGGLFLLLGGSSTSTTGPIHFVSTTRAIAKVIVPEFFNVSLSEENFPSNRFLSMLRHWGLCFQVVVFHVLLPRKEILNAQCVGL